MKLMKSCLLFLIITASAAVGVAQTQDWTELNQGEKKGTFQFSQARTLLYNGRPLLGIRFRSSVEKIAISPGAVGGKYVICVAFDNIESVAFLIKLQSYSGKRLALQGPPSVWASWSPAGTHVLIGSYYEADEALYSISLPSGIVRRFSFKVSKQHEEESYDLDNLTWLSDRVFRVRVKVSCNPYTDDNCSEEDRTKVLREYEVQANVATLAVSSDRIMPRASATGLRSDTCSFCGVWKAVPGGRLGRRADDLAGNTGNPYCGCDYLKITKAGTGKFELSTGFEYEGRLTWAEPFINNADGVYLRPVAGKLIGRFVSSNFYATHGHDFTYKITAELKNDHELVFSVWCSIRGGETERATYRKMGE